MFKSVPIQEMNNAYDVKGKNVVVTGGNAGIGRGIAQAFAECGANVAIFCRRHESGLQAVSELEKFGGKYAAFKCNVADHESVRTASAEYFKVFGSVDVIVNNAGVVTKEPFLSEKGLDEWHRVIDINLHGPANVVYELAPKMIEAGKGGTIISISSVTGQRVSETKTRHCPPYNVSKAGLDIFSRYLAVALSEHGIRANTLVLGPIDTDMTRKLPQSAREAFENEFLAHRFGSPIEVGALCVYMASPAGSFVTGVNWAFDGGMLCVE